MKSGELQAPREEETSGGLALCLCLPLFSFLFPQLQSRRRQEASGQAEEGPEGRAERLRRSWEERDQGEKVLGEEERTRCNEIFTFSHQNSAQHELRGSSKPSNYPGIQLRSDLKIKSQWALFFA